LQQRDDTFKAIDLLRRGRAAPLARAAGISNRTSYDMNDSFQDADAHCCGS
jgi:hypothetical protein